jgi:NADH dehydrogenase
VLKAKGIAEEFIRKSGVPYTILRGSLLFGPGDEFTTGLAMLLAAAPGFLPLPSNGGTLVQPLWVEDLVTCLIWSLENPDTINQTCQVGGSEHISLRQDTTLVMQASNQPRRLVTLLMDSLFPRFPASIFWLDYLAVNRTCALDSVPRLFGLMPSRFASRLDYLRNVHWTRSMLGTLFTRHD